MRSAFSSSSPRWSFPLKAVDWRRRSPMWRARKKSGERRSGNRRKCIRAKICVAIRAEHANAGFRARSPRASRLPRHRPLPRQRHQLPDVDDSVVATPSTGSSTSCRRCAVEWQGASGCLVARKRRTRRIWKGRITAGARATRTSEDVGRCDAEPYQRAQHGLREYRRSGKARRGGARPSEGAV